MYYLAQFDLQSTILKRHKYSQPLYDFGRHAGEVRIFKFEPHPLLDGARILGSWPVKGHFDRPDGIVQRHGRVFERFYLELTQPQDRFHASNVIGGLQMGSFALGISLEWLVQCPAPEKLAIRIANRMFDCAKVHVGQVALSTQKLAPTELGTATSDMSMAMIEIKANAMRQYSRIVA